MSYRTARNKAEETCERFEEARLSLAEFISDNQSVFDVFYDLAERYNTLRVEAKDSVKRIDGNEKLTIRSFNRSKAPEEWKYVAHNLPAEVLATPGVVSKINNKAIEQGLISGQFSIDQIDNHRTRKFGTPRVTCPPEISIKTS